MHSVAIRLLLAAPLLTLPTALVADGGARLTRPSAPTAPAPSTPTAPAVPLPQGDEELPFTPYRPPTSSAPIIPSTATPTHTGERGYHVPGAGLITQVQGREGEATAAASPTPEPSSYASPFAESAPLPPAGLPERSIVIPGQQSIVAPGNYEPSIEAARPIPGAAPLAAPTPTATPTPRQPVRPQGPQLVYRFSLDRTFRELARRNQPVPLNIWFPGSSTLGNSEVALGSAIAQGIALRCGESPVIASSSPSIRPGHFNVVVGLPGELRGMITEADLPAAAHGRLVLREVTQHPDTQLLFITGNSMEGIQSAILSLGLARAPLPTIPTASIREVVLPTAPPFMRREPVRGDAIHTFEYLHTNGTGIYRTSNGGLRLVFNLPGDFDPTLTGDILLNLHTSLPEHAFAGRIPQLFARVNGSNELISAPLGEAEGKSARSSLAMPLNLFRIGENEIEVNFPSVAGSARFNVYGDSTLSTPRCTTPPTLPNLFLFNRTGYPLIGQPDGSEMLVMLAGRTPANIGSAWTLLARLAQTSNTMFHATEYASTTDAEPTPPAERHVIIVGTERELPEADQALLPDDLFREKLVLQPVEEVIHGVTLKGLLDQGRESFVTKVAPSPTPEVARKAPAWPKDQRGFLGCYPPEEKVHGWILILTAQNEALLVERTAQLVSAPFWKGITGSSVYWNTTPESLEVYQPTPPPSSRQANKANTDDWVEMPFGERFATHNWLKAIGFTLLILIVTLIKSLRRNSNLRDYTS